MLFRSVLCRPTFLPWLGLGVLWVGGMTFRRDASNDSGTYQSRTVIIRHAVAFVVGASLVLAPWGVRNLAVLGRAKLTTTHGGYTVLLGNNPSFYAFLRSDRGVSVWDATPLADAWNARNQTSGPKDPAWNDLGQLSELAPDSGPRAWDEFRDDRFAYQLAARFI